MADGQVPEDDLQPPEEVLPPPNDAQPPRMARPPNPYGTAQLTDASTGSADIAHSDCKITAHRDFIREALSVHSDLLVYLKHVPSVAASPKALMIHALVVQTVLNTLESDALSIASLFCDFLTAIDTPLRSPNDELGTKLNNANTDAEKLKAYKEYFKSIWVVSENPLILSEALKPFMIPAPAAGQNDNATPETRRLINAFLDMARDWDNSDIVDMMEACYDVIESLEPKSLSHGALSDLIAGTIAYTCGGEISRPKLTKIKNALRTEHNLEINVDIATIKQVYRLIRLCLSEVSVPPGLIIKRLAHIFPIEHYLRVHLIIRQSLGVNASMINFIENALSISLLNPIWPALISRFETEWEAVVAALRTLAADGYAALGASSEVVKATNFPNFGYAAISILTRAGHGHTLSRYKGKANCVDPQFIDGVLDAYEKAQVQVITPESVAQMPIPEWATLLPDLAIAGRLIRDGTLDANHIL